MPGPARRGPGLTLRVVALLSVALLPLGAIATWQTQRSAAQAARDSEITLLALTERAADPMQAAVQRAFGLVAGLAHTLPALVEDSGRCSRFLEAALAGEDAYSYLAFVPVSGIMTCSSDGRTFDFSGFPAFEDTLADPRRRVTVNPAAPLSGTAVVIVTEPVFGPDGRLLGTLSVSLPQDRLDLGIDLPPLEGPLSLLTFNAEGMVLTATLAEAERQRQLPRDRVLTDLAGEDAQAFTDVNADGRRRAYAVVPVVPEAVYALASWPQDALVRTRFDRIVATALMPLLMWAASLAVAYVALDRLVIRHVKILSRQMRAFARTRRMVREPMLVRAGTELADMERDFREMAGAILHDEAELEDALRQKNRLLKEVHHRVKNNLQLISSVINMQVRKSRSAEAAGVLRRLQDRIMSIATVHRSLYGSDDLDRVDAGRLVEELAGQIILGARGERPGLQLHVEAEPVSLDADQAVPLSLLVSEAVTNAARHAPRGGPARIDLRFRRVGERDARLELENPAEPIKAGGEGEDGRSGPGLGVQLIRAFASQLGGRIDVREEADRYRLRVDFPVRDGAYLPLDY